MTQIICLANSWKNGERCIAGINIDTKKWIRPVSSLNPKDGKVPRSVRLIEGKEPALLDVLDIPLENNGPDFGFESENITIGSGKWQLVERVQPTDLLEYCHNYSYILHNSNKYVTVSSLQSLPFQERRTLELVYATKFSVKEDELQNGKWKGTLITDTGLQLTETRITDPVFVERLKSSYRPHNPCLVSVSLGMPYKPPTWGKDDPYPCWKLIAGVIELSEFDLILVEMKRIGWSIKQGRSYLEKNYKKYSRQELNKNEITEFLNYLKSLPSI
ncbi:dual OB domain-containing protein [Calothrix sp. CCY 0018]|uniref:dual OB domain-containing protein n=1 Tax=Calothrix sp. CCY 0018 TaxID=3103864 RepID=UPI0039C72BD2